MKPSDRFDSLIQYYAERVGLPADLLKRQMMAESAGNPNAVSPSGAVGLFQLMTPAAQDMGCHDRTNPDQNIRAGTEYLARQLANVKLAAAPSPVAEDDLLRFALASYNAGFGYVRAALKEITARQLPITWNTFAQIFPNVTVRDRKPDWKQVQGYITKILPVE